MGLTFVDMVLIGIGVLGFVGMRYYAVRYYAMRDERDLELHRNHCMAQRAEIAEERLRTATRMIFLQVGDKEERQP